MEQLRRKIRDFVLSVERTKALYEDKSKLLTATQETRVKLEKDFTELRDVAVLLEKCNITAREIIKSEVESLVTSALTSVFEKTEIEFKIEFVSRRNQIEAEFLVTSMSGDQKAMGDIMDAHGGGIVDVIATALRLILIELLHINGPLVLDEPGRMISEQYTENFGKFLHTMSQKFDRQIILITHNTKLAAYADKQFNVSLCRKTKKSVVIS